MTRDASGRVVAPDQHAPRPIAVYAYLQPDDAGGYFRMYHVVGGVADKSTVTAETLVEMGIEVPGV